KTATPTRAQLIKNKALYGNYLDWWFGQRRKFLIATRDFIRNKAGVKDGIVLFTSDSSEGGTGIGKAGIVTDSPAIWGKQKTFPYSKAVKNNLSGLSQISPRFTWGGWEWQHSIPRADPQRYKDTEGIFMSYGFNRLYTVSSTKPFDQFRVKSGLAIVRHYVLNENAMTINKKSPVGYYVCDVDNAGVYHMLAEARSLAYGDPRYIGYMAGSLYTSGFPEYARAFNQAFMSLPAVPSKLLGAVSSNKEVLVREYKTKAHGTWYAVINVGLNDAIDVAITLPGENFTNAISGEALTKKTVSLYPSQVLTWHSK
ncbi:MAG: hypothetical protein HRT89_23240, partial [Lentisphaeria bacterium]|nr:hypothetical protein [Lentisphaeria bacterium]NQZ70976.1 hypothetical protein [Lentisphaeria bacterium]